MTVFDKAPFFNGLSHLQIAYGFIWNILQKLLSY